ncbi:MAG: glycosyltransferase family 2 protein [Rhodobacterales bacterium]|nr:glycosyltransferase family 2 protein [Rhodobacterales bacterium]
MTSVSFIVCTYDRYDIVDVALNSIIVETAGAGYPVEILLVDNTPPARRRDIEVPDGVTVLPCDRSGLAVARNAGIAASTGDIVVFVDDDAELQPGYLAALLSGFRTAPEAQVIGGRTLPVFPDERPAWFSDRLLGYLSCIDWGDTLRPLKPGEFVVGANIAFRRSVFDRFGGFNESLGRIGTASLLSNEESELLGRLPRDAVFYNPRQVVGHHIPPSRLQQAWFRKRVVWQAVSDVLGGMRYMDDKAALQSFGEIQAALDPSKRGLGFLMQDAEDAVAFDRQLKLVYCLMMLSANGFDAHTAGLTSHG